MYRQATIAVAVLIGAFAPAAEAKSKHHHDDMVGMPTMEQCQGGYQKDYKASMHWSKHKFKHTCHKLMKHEAKMHKGMMNDDAKMHNEMVKDKKTPNKADTKEKDKS
jgi:hypothetical protein